MQFKFLAVWLNFAEFLCVKEFSVSFPWYFRIINFAKLITQHPLRCWFASSAGGTVWSMDFQQDRKKNPMNLKRVKEFRGEFFTCTMHILTMFIYKTLPLIKYSANTINFHWEMLSSLPSLCHPAPFAHSIARSFTWKFSSWRIREIVRSLILEIMRLFGAFGGYFLNAVSQSVYWVVRGHQLGPLNLFLIVLSSFSSTQYILSFLSQHLKY